MPGAGRWTALLAGLAAGAALAGCQRAAPPPSAATDRGCLYGTAEELASCETYDNEPEQCRIAGGLYDAATGRCLR
jgi:hypothetical protein